MNKAKNNYKKKIELIFFLIFISNNLIYSQLTSQDSLKKIAEKQLKEVVIRGIKKPVLETKSDRFVFNVENSSLVEGNNVLNVLQQTPLLSVDEETGINIMGFQKAVVYINNRKSVLIGKDLLNYLKNMPADNIVKIEIITTPSARYDATDGGVINLVLKKIDSDGLKGNFSLTDELKRLNSINASSYLNYHKNRFSQSTSLFIGKDNNLSYDNSVNRIFIDSSSQIINSEKRIEDFHFGGTTSMDYELNEKNIIGGLLELDSTTLENFIYNNNYTVLNDNSQTNGYLSNSCNDGGSRMMAGNLFYKFNDEKTGKNLDINLDWNYQDLDNNTVFNTYVSEDEKQWIYANFIKTEETRRNYSFKIDYSQPILKTGYNLEIGSKINYLILKSIYVFNDWNGNEFVLNTANSNNFNYDENINALYFNIDKQYFKSLDLKFGLRVENTNIKTLQEVNQIRNDRNFTNWLPFFNLNYKINAQNSVALSYKKSVWRPYSNEFNPFITFYNLENGRSGNPNLKIEESQVYKLNYSLKKKYSFFISYKMNSNYINNSVVDGGNLLIMKPLNLYGEIRSYTVGFNLNNSFFKNKLSSNITSSMSYLDNEDVSKKNNLIFENAFSYRFQWVVNLKNIMDSGINLGAFFGVLTPSNYGNFSITKPSTMTYFDLSKNFTKQELKIVLKVKDPLNVYNWGTAYHSPIGDFDTDYQKDYRGVSLSIIKKFGNAKSKETQKTELEKGRIETGQSVQ